METYTSTFKALSDPTRLRAMKLLLAHGTKICVCEISEALDLPQYQISKHLTLLRHAGLVSDTRAGTWVYYEANQSDSFRKTLFDLLRNEVASEAPFGHDLERLRRALARRADR